MDINQQRVKIIKEKLQNDSSAELAENMSTRRKRELIKVFCNGDRVSPHSIVGFLQDSMALISNVFSSILSKQNRQGILFLEECCYYGKGSLESAIRIDYSEIKYVDNKTLDLVLYKTKSNYIKLHGLSYVEPTSIPSLFINLCELNDKQICVTKTDKLKNTAVKVGKIAYGMFMESSTDYSDIEKKAKAQGRDDILEEINAKKEEEIAFKQALEQKRIEFMSNHSDRYSEDEVKAAECEMQDKSKIYERKQQYKSECEQRRNQQSPCKEFQANHYEPVHHNKNK